MSQQITHFDAFISYRHSDLDSFVAETLQKKLETFKLPRNSSEHMKRTGKNKLYHIFRDREELPLTYSLTDYITTALENSDFLIVICSPRTPESLWVRREIETFIKLHGRDHVLAVLIEGEPEDSFPEPLLVEEVQHVLPNGEVEIIRNLVEPLAADLRASDNKTMEKKMKSEMLRLVAAMLGCSYDDLKQRHKERRNKRILAFSIALSAVCLSFGSFSYYQTCQIKATLKEKQVTQSRSLADTSTRLLDDGDRIKSILVAERALPSGSSATDRPFVASAEYALCNALQVYANNTTLCVDRTLSPDSNNYITKLSPSAQYLLCYDDRNYLYIWDTTTSKSVYKSEVPINNLSDSLIYFTDDNTIVYADSNQIHCFDFKNNNMIWECDASYTNHMVLNQDHTILAATDTSNLVFLNVATGEVIFQQSISETDDISTYVTYLAFSPDSSMFAVAFSDMINLYSITDKCKTDKISATSTGITEVLFKDNNTLFYSTSDILEPDSSSFYRSKGSLIFWDIKAKKELWQNDKHDSSYTNLQLYDQTPGQLWCKSNDTFCIFDTQTGATIFENKRPRQIVNYYPLSENAVLLGQADGTIEYLLFSINLEVPLISGRNTLIKNLLFQNKLFVAVEENSDNNILYQYKKGAKYETLDTMSSAVSSFSYSSDDKYLLGYSEESGEIHLLDADSKKVLNSNTVESGQTISSVSFCNQNKNYIVVSTNDTNDINTKDFTITLYGASSGEKIADAIFEKCNNVYIAPDQTKAFVQTADETTYEVIKLDLSDLSQTSLFTSDSFIYSCLISRDSSRLAIRCANNITIYNLKDGSSSSIEGMFSSITLGNTSKSLCAINNDTKELQMYSMEDWSLIHSQPVAASTVETMQYDRNDENLLISYGDRSIEVFDCKTWKRVPSFENYKNDMYINQILFPDNADYIILYSQDHSYICTSSFEVLACIPNLLDYREDLKEFVVSSNTELVKFPFYNLDMLLKEAKAQLDGRALTSDEMSELFID